PRILYLNGDRDRLRRRVARVWLAGEGELRGSAVRDVEAAAGGAGQSSIAGGQLVAGADLAHVQVAEAGDAVRGGLAGRAVAGQAGAGAAAAQAERDRVARVGPVVDRVAEGVLDRHLGRDRGIGGVGGIRLDAEGEVARASVLDREVVAGRRHRVVGDRQVATALCLVAGGVDRGAAGAEVGRIVEDDRSRARARTAGRRAVE